MSICFTKSGILNTVQDLGRFGRRRDGINPGGAMDRASLRILNVLLGNRENEAAIELHFPAGEIEFRSPCIFALAGADFDPHLDGIPIATWKTHSAHVGSLLTFAKRIAGHRAYLGTAGGFDIPAWLESRSTNLAVGVGGFYGRTLIAGDCIELNDVALTAQPLSFAAGYSITATFRPSFAIRMICGPESPFLTPLSTEVLLTGRYRISNDSNRMGYHLEGEPLFLLEPVEMISTSVDYGTIQLLPNGQPVILMADHQTTGGYPRIGQVIRRDLPLLGQLGAGDEVSFELISVADAERLDLEFERQLLFLKAGRRLKIGE